MTTTHLPPAPPETVEPAPRGSPWFLVASVVLLLIGTVGLVFSTAPGCCGAPSGPPDRVRTAPIPDAWAGDVLAAAEFSGLPPEIVAAQLDVESRWDPRAVSSAGAQGLAQFMPETWAEYGRGDPFDPRAAIRAQGIYLKDLRRMVRALEPASPREEIDLVLAAYNAGPTVVLGHGGIPPIEETRLYVEQIQELAGTTYAGVGR
jgi:Transglycosylase SLT domain